MSVIVVDNDLKDSINEYGQILDSVNEKAELAEKFQSFFNENNELTKREELVKAIHNNSQPEVLTKLPDKEFEPAFNLLIYIILQLEKSLGTAIIDDVVKCNPAVQPSLRDRKSVKTSSILSILSNAFNLVPETSPIRIYILKQILNLVENSSLSFSLIQTSIGDNIVTWLEKANAPPEEIKFLFWKFITLDEDFSLKSLELIKTFTSHYRLINLDQLIRFALSSEIVDVSFLVNNNVANAIRENKDNELVVIFNSYIKGELISSVPSDLPKDLIISKSRILALAKFFVDNENKHVFSYKDIPLTDSPEEFEKLIINSIKAGIIEGKLNQVEQSFYLTRVSRLIIAGEDNSKDWDALRQVLVNWKNSITNIDSIVNTSRENIVNNNNN
ncbi:uncharacterized protein PRCAT00004548001 [Priceomyces carsonii]|uniref:uncharacterized protein n=1 Tax=Priceomyces carsonii TaxID=28549 RepID=UPI002ED7EA32|nr:unnamed protein product [Priceomyces carsonii]